MRLPRWALRSVSAGLLVLGLGLLGPPPAARAGGVTRTVPSSPDCDTIQECVDNSLGGDTIQVQPDTYFENVTIPAGKDGLTIMGVRGFRNRSCERVIVDATLLGTPGVGFLVQSDNVTLDCLLVQNGTTGVLGDVGADGLSLRRVNVVGMRDPGGSGDCDLADADGDGIFVNGLDAGIDRAKVDGVDCEGISLLGDDADVLNSQVRNAGGSCIQVASDDNRLERNQVRRCATDDLEEAGINVEGDRNALIENRIQDSDEDCIQVFGNNVRLERNTVIGCGENGIEVIGDNPDLVSNRTDRTENEGVEISCTPESEFGPPGATGDCTAGRVTGNLAAGSQEDAGFFIFVDPAGPSPNGLQIVNNTAQGNTGSGFLIEMSDGLVEGNTALRNGSDNQDEAFSVIGSRNTIRDNLSRENKEDGFNIDGDNNQVLRNRAIANGEDGLEVFGTDNLLDGNTATNNLGEGIENDGTTTDLINNTSSGNRQDCAGNGSEDQLANNFCADGSDFDDPGQVDRAGRPRPRQSERGDNRPRGGRR